MSKTYKKSAITKAAILAAAVRLAERTHYLTIGRDAIAKEADCAQGSVSKYFTTMPLLRRAVISHAIATGNLRILAQGLSAGDSKAKCAPLELQRQAAESTVAA